MMDSRQVEIVANHEIGSLIGHLNAARRGPRKRLVCHPAVIGQVEERAARGTDLLGRVDVVPDERMPPYSWRLLDGEELVAAFLTPAQGSGLITALRRRANDLYGKSLSERWQGEDVAPEMRPIYRVLAAEFRALAREAEGLESQPALGEESP